MIRWLLVLLALACTAPSIAFTQARVPTARRGAHPHASYYFPQQQHSSFLFRGGGDTSLLATVPQKDSTTTSAARPTTSAAIHTQTERQESVSAAAAADEKVTHSSAQVVDPAEVGAFGTKRTRENDDAMCGVWMGCVGFYNQGFVMRRIE